MGLVSVLVEHNELWVLIMKSWRLLARAKGQCLYRRASVRTVSRNVQLMHYRNLCGAVDSCSSGAEGDQPRQPGGSWTPHVLGLVSVGLLLCGGRKGKSLRYMAFE